MPTNKNKFQGTLLDGFKIYKFPASSAHKVIFHAIFVTGSGK